TLKDSKKIKICCHTGRPGAAKKREGRRQGAERRGDLLGYNLGNRNRANTKTIR
ncbi:hypothetical protein NDU88_003662, partial [Pleurodeles waltl]